MPTPVIMSSIHFISLCGAMFAKSINYYVIWCSSFDAFLQIQSAPQFQLFVGNFIFALNYAILKKNIKDFVFITAAQYICWCMSFLKMPMEVTIVTSLLIIFSEGYRYYHFMILSTHWAKFVIKYSLGSYLMPHILQLLVFLLSTVCSFALLPVVRNVKNISLYVIICYHAKYYFTGTLNFIVQPFSMKHSLSLCRLSPITKCFLLCLIVMFPYESVRIRNYIERYI